jgi:peroxiredoxin
MHTACLPQGCDRNQLVPKDVEECINKIPSNFLERNIMHKRIISAVFGLLGAVVLLNAQDKLKKVENFTLDDVNGAKHSLSDYSKQKAIVLMFIATECPVSNAYNTRMADLHKDYKDKGIVFLGINANKQETVAAIQAHAKEHGFAFAILKDRENKIADKLEASVTPEIYVLSPNLEIQYHGRIDDSRNLASIKSRDLRKALDEILAGKAVSVPQTKAFGCTIKRVSEGFHRFCSPCPSWRNFIVGDYSCQSLRFRRTVSCRFYQLERSFPRTDRHTGNRDNDQAAPWQGPGSQYLGNMVCTVRRRVS